MRKYAVIVAAGSGTRLGGDVPKQFQKLTGRPVLWWSIKAFHEEDPSTEIIVVLADEWTDYWQHHFQQLPESEKIPHIVVSGGPTRTESVKNGLYMVKKDDSLVSIHDGARPLVTHRMIEDGWAVADKEGSAIPVIPVTDSLRKKGDHGSVAVNRSDFMVVQTPQVFRTSILKKAYDLGGEDVFTDDATVVENAGFPIHLYNGDARNIKVTNPGDIQIAQVIMSQDV